MNWASGDCPQAVVRTVVAANAAARVLVFMALIHLWISVKPQLATS